jgi:hypothetical protein
VRPHDEWVDDIAEKLGGLPVQPSRLNEAGWQMTLCAWVLAIQEDAAADMLARAIRQAACHGATSLVTEAIGRLPVVAPPAG